MIKYIFVPIIACYLIAAFICWDYNPSNWGWFARLAVIFLGLCIGSLMCDLDNGSKKEETK